MVKIDSKEMFNKMDPRKDKIQIYPSKQHCGYNKMSNQLPKLTKTIMSPLTTMPPKKLMIAPQQQQQQHQQQHQQHQQQQHNGLAIKPNPSAPQPTNMCLKVEPPTPVNIINNAMQLSAMKNNFAAKNYVSMPNPMMTTNAVVQPKSEPKIIDKVKETAAVAASASTAAGYRSEKISLDALHPYITCFLCRGYLIEATTIVECLHTYCHSCLMRHLAKDKCCPQCDMSINKSKTNIKYDATIQSIVYKLVPGLYLKEILKRRAFYRQHPDEAKLASPEERGDDTEHLILSPLDLISLSLDYAEKETLQGMEADENIQKLLRPKYLNCPAIFKVEHLKKFIVNKFLINSSKFNVEISYKVKTIVLPEHYTLMDVAYIYTWKKEAPMPFFFRIIAKNSKCDELPEVALRRSPTTTLPNVAEETLTKKKSVSFKDEVEAIDKRPESKDKSLSKASHESVKKSPQNPPRIETIKLKLDVSNNNVSIIKNTDSPSHKSDSKHKKHSEKKEKKNKHENSLPKYSIDNEKSQPKDANKDEYEFDDDIDQQKLGFLNTFQLTAKKILDTKSKMKNDSSAKSFKSDCTPSTNNRHNLLQKQTENNINKRKSKEPVKATPKKYKFHEMKSVGEGNKFLFTKTGDGHEITFDMSPKPLGSKPPLSKVKSDIMLAQQRAEAKAHKEINKPDNKAPSESSPTVVDKPINNNNNNNSSSSNNNNSQRNIAIKPKKLPMLLPKQPSSPAPISSMPPPTAMSPPRAFVIKKPETKKDFTSNEISVTKINDQNHHLRVYGPKSPAKLPVKEIAPPTSQFKSADGFAQPLPPKIKSNALPAPTQILKPYGYPIKMPKNIPENMQTPYGCRTPFYVPSSPSYTPNFDAKPQFKYASPNAYASFMQSMFCAGPTAGKISPPINSQATPKSPAENPRKRPSIDNNNSSVPAKRKSPSPTKPAETDSKAISILNKINFPSSLSVTLTNEQEENKKEQLRSQKQSVVNNNIEIIKISEERDAKLNAAKLANASQADKKVSNEKKSVEQPKKLTPILPALVPHPSMMLNPSQMLTPPIAKALSDSKESFQRAFLESLLAVTSKQNVEKAASSRKKETSKSPETTVKDEKDKVVKETTEEPVNFDSKSAFAPKNLLVKPEGLLKKNVSLTPPPGNSADKAPANSNKSLTPPPLTSHDPAVYASSAAQAMQFNMMFNALNAAAAKAPHFAAYPDYANIQRSMLLETLRQNVEKSSALLAMHHQIQQQHQQHSQKTPSSSHSPSSSASSPSSKH